MSTVRHFLRSRPASHKVHVLSPQHTAWDALEIMAEHNIGALPVIEDGRLVGFFSERDYTRKVELKGRTAATTPIHEIMVRKVITGSLDHKI
ncbi:MAG: CBS domain-containing protein, partial [Bacteroidota bacterium]